MTASDKPSEEFRQSVFGKAMASAVNALLRSLIAMRDRRSAEALAEMAECQSMWAQVERLIAAELRKARIEEDVEIMEWIRFRNQTDRDSNIARLIDALAYVIERKKEIAEERAKP